MRVSQKKGIIGAQQKKDLYPIVVFDLRIKAGNSVKDVWPFCHASENRIRQCDQSCLALLSRAKAANLNTPIASIDERAQ